MKTSPLEKQFTNLNKCSFGNSQKCIEDFLSAGHWEDTHLKLKLVPSRKVGTHI